MSVLKAKEISKSIRRMQLYTDVCFNVEQGDCYAVLGGDNEGKTSIINALLGFDSPDKGDIFLFGEQRTRKNAKALMRRIGYVPDDLLCFDHMTGAGLLDMTIALRKLEDPIEYAEALIAFFDINPGMLLEEMNEDMNKCTYLISAFLSKPELVILDEPFNFLGEESSFKLKKLIGMYQELGNTVVLTGTDYNEVADICSRFSVLQNGRQIRCDALPEQYEDMKLILARNAEEIPRLLEYAEHLDGALKQVKESKDKTVLLFKGEMEDLKSILAHLNCSDFEIQNITVRDQIMQEYD